MPAFHSGDPRQVDRHGAACAEFYYVDDMASHNGGARRGPGGDRGAAAIKNAAAELVIEAADTAGLTLHAIAERTGLDEDVIAMYVDSADELLRELLTDSFAACLARMDLEVSLLPAGATALEDLRAVATGYLAYAAEDPRGYALAYGVRNARQLGLNRLDEGGHPGAQALDTVVAGVELCRPDLPPDEARERAVGLWLALHGLVQIRSHRPLVDLPETARLVRTTVDAFVGQQGRGLRLVPPR